MQEKDGQRDTESGTTPRAGMLPIVRPVNQAGASPDGTAAGQPRPGRPVPESADDAPVATKQQPRPARAQSRRHHRHRGKPELPKKPVAKEAKPVPAGTAPLPLPKNQQRTNAAARRMLRKLVQGEAPPTAPMSIVERLAGSPYANPLVQSSGVDASARLTLDFALDVAETMLRFGAGALEVESSIIAVTAAFGLRDVDVDITNQSVVINYARPDTVPMNVLRVVRSWTNNYAGLSAVHQLVTDIVNGGVGRTEAKERLKQITSRPKPFPRWMAIGAGGVFSAAITGFMGGGIFAGLVALLATVLMGLLGRKLNKWRVPDFFVTAVGACLATVAALVFFQLRVPLSPALVIAGGILYLLPTGRLVSATQDAINGFPVTAMGRYLSAFLTFAAIASGVAVGLVAGNLAGVSLPEIFVEGGISYPFIVRAALLMVATIAISITEQTRANILLPTALVGVVGLMVYEAVLLAGLGSRISPFVAAVVIGFLGRIVGLRLGSPQLVVAVPAVLFLLPGFSVFRAIYELTISTEQAFNGMIGLLGALTVILAMAGGTVLGDYLAQPLTRDLGSNEGRRRNRRR